MASVTPRTFGWLHAAPAVMLLLAIAPWPYAYYQLLRLVVCGCAVALIWWRLQTGKGFDGWAKGLAAIAVLFNPIVPFELARGIWFVFDLIVPVLFGIHYVDTRDEVDSGRESETPPP